MMLRPPRRIAVLGAETRVAFAAARIWVAQGVPVVLVAADQGRLRILEDDLRLRASGTVEIHSRVADLMDLSGLTGFWKDLRERFPDLDAVLLAQGATADLARCEAAPEALLENFRCNALSPLALLTVIANDFAEQRQGCIGVLTSTFGDRGVHGYHIEGAASAALAVYLAGLRQRLMPRSVRVLTLKLGPIATPGNPQGPETRLLHTPAERLAKGIVDAFARRNGEIHLPPRGRWIPWLVRLPNALRRN